MKKYIGTKIIEAEPMNLGDYNKFRGWTIPADEDPKLPGSRVVYEDGYVSWSPAEAFKAYRPCDAMTFGLAIEAMKARHRVARAGWNGKGMWLCYVAQGHFDVGVGTVGAGCEGLYPWIGMRTADQKFVPWLASQTDMLSEDWMICD